MIHLEKAVVSPGSHIAIVGNLACRQSAVFWKFLPCDSLLNPLDFLVSVQILQYMKFSSLLYTNQVYFLNHDSKSFRPLELEGIIVDCFKCVPIPVKKKQQQQDSPPWVAENSTTHLMTFGFLVE